MREVLRRTARRLLVGRDEAPEPPASAFCESRTVSGAEPWHVRALDGSGGPTVLRPSGSASPLRTLCGRELLVGSWDVDVPVTRRRVASRHVTHGACADELLRRGGPFAPEEFPGA